MLRVVKTFNGHNLNDGVNYKAAGVSFDALPAAKPVFIEQQLTDQVASGAWSVEVGSVPLYIRIVGANRDALLAQLKNWFKRGTQGDLVVTFRDEVVDFQKTCRVVNLVRDRDYPDTFIVLLQTGQTAWRAVSPTSYAWSLSSSGGTHTETLSDSDDETRLSVTFEASGLPTVGYLYQNLLRIVPPHGVTYGVRPWRAVMDTAALIADASKSNQVNLGGGINASTLTIPIDTPVGGGLSTGSGLCYVDTEQIQYTSISGGNINVATGGRGYGGTTAATHADNAVIKQSGMQANCSDLRVVIGDTETRRWIVSPNTASTKIWFNPDLQTGYHLICGAAIGSSGDISVLQLKVDATHQQAVAVMPDEGILYHGTEWIAYRGRNATKCQLLNPTRGCFSTTKQAHSVGDAFDFIPAAARMVWGNSAVGDPAADDVYYDETKPLFDLTLSDNTQWVYDATDSLFYDPLEPNRPGAWQQEVLRVGDVSAPYTESEDVDGGDPALGCKIGSFLKGVSWIAENATIAWKFFAPGGIQEISATGQTYRNTSAFPTVAALQYQAVVATTVTTRVKKKRRTITIYSTQWLSSWNEASPTNLSTWTAWTHNTVSVPNTTMWARFALSGTLTALADAIAAFEALTVTVVFTSANVPAAAFLGVTSNYPLDLELTNNTNDDSLSVDFSMRTNVPLVIDGEEFTAIYQGVNVHQSIEPNDESRDVFIRLQAGDNDLQVSAVDLGALTATLSYYRRRL